MANPFLVLGGVAVGVITAGIGVLSVPGWIDSANDSAAMNDLGNIRGAESAAILQLGEYTDDFAILKSGELGVKFQKSDGVTLIGLKADSNESWCASVLSKSGRFFAASNNTARFATGPGAESAMTAVGCDPALIDIIIDEAIRPGGPDGGNGSPAPIGTPGTTGGHYVGENPSAGGPGGGTVTPAPLGAAVPLDTPAASVWTAHGSFTINTSSTLLRSGGDGAAHTFTVTGPAAGVQLQYTAQIGTDSNGNLYVVNRSGDKMFRIAPDGSSTDITPATKYTGGGIPHDPQINTITATPDGTVYFHGSDYVDAEDTQFGIFRMNGNQSEFVGYTEYEGNGVNPSMLGVAGGEVFFAQGDNKVLVMDASGTVSLLAEQEIEGMVVASDGTVYGGQSGDIIRITRDGSVSVFASANYNGNPYTAPDDAIGDPIVGGIDRSGNIIVHDQYLKRLYSVASGGAASLIMK